jgi:hypothetical protein
VEVRVTDTVPGCRVLERARSQDTRFSWVLLAELRDGDSCFARGFVVWYEDERKRRSQGHYTSSHADARAVFARRGIPALGRAVTARAAARRAP